eukprot:SAG11_NODE_1952_length_4011_cov_3.936605_4_plen_54_part_00
MLEVCAPRHGEARAHCATVIDELAISTSCVAAASCGLKIRKPVTHKVAESLTR